MVGRCGSSCRTSTAGRAPNGLEPLTISDIPIAASGSSAVITSPVTCGVKSGTRIRSEPGLDRAACRRGECKLGCRSRRFDRRQRGLAGRPEAGPGRRGGANTRRDGHGSAAAVHSCGIGPVKPDAGTPSTADSARKARLARAVQQEDHDDQEDGLLTTVLFVVLGLCIIMAPVSYTHLRAHETDSYLVC